MRGTDIMALGDVEGPEIGDMLRRLEADWIAAGFAFSREELLARAADAQPKITQARPIRVAAKASVTGTSGDLDQHVAAALFAGGEPDLAVRNSRKLVCLVGQRGSATLKDASNRNSVKKIAKNRVTMVRSKSTPPLPAKAIHTTARNQRTAPMAILTTMGWTPVSPACPFSSAGLGGAV